MVHTSNRDILTLSLPQKIASAGLAGCTADLCTFPLDTVKVWLQVRGEAPASFSTSGSTHPPIAGTSSLNNPSSSYVRPTLATQAFKPLTIKNKVVSIKKEPKIILTGGKAELASPKKSTKNAVKSVHKYVASSKQKAKSRTSNFAQFSKTQFKPKTSVRTASGSAAALARSATNPGLFGTIIQGVRSNGFFSLYGGISAGLQRQVAFCAVRIGLYDSVKGFYQRLLPSSRDGKQVVQRILAGTTTAFIAVGLFQPTEVVKIRMQAQTSKPAEARIYSSSFQAYRAIFNVGIREAWKGVETNAARLAVVNVCELVTYDLVKETILDYRLMKDNPACHFTSAFISGFITTVIASPIDVVKTRYMNSKAGHYKGPIDCAKNMFLSEGFRAFYKGFVPAYLRLGSWNIVMFLSYEQYKRLFHRYNENAKLNSKTKLENGYIASVE